MKDFNSNRRSGPPSGGFGGKRFGGGGGGGGFGGKRFGGGFGGRDGGRDGGRPQMHQAVCDACGNACEVPFKPTGEKPVYCRDCFQNGGESSSGGSKFGNRDSFQSRSFSKPGFEDRAMHHAVCAECGDDCEVPFRPVAGKPVYCKNCFGKADKGGEAPKRSAAPGGSDQMQQLSAKVDALKAQFEKLSDKLNKILWADAPVVTEKKDAKKAPEMKKEEKKPEAKSAAKAKPAAAPKKAEKPAMKKEAPKKAAKPAAKKAAPAAKAAKKKGK